MNGAIGLSGLHIGDNQKALHNPKFQLGMTQTYNLNILNNSFNIGNAKSMTMTTGGPGGDQG